MNYKKTINVILRCGIYAYIVSRMFHLSTQTNIISDIVLLKIFVDLFIFEIIFNWLPSLSDNTINNIANIFLFINSSFFIYFFAKICGLYKTFKDFKLWQKFLIFLLITILIFPVGIFDFKNFEVFKEFFEDKNNYTAIIFPMLFIIPAFLLNLFFNFLTKKFPKPFERIGYYCSIEFFKDIFKRNKA
ncbi:MAG: hypothetical protein IJW73_00740 [Candidatus Gastranaerophilales bacterium]|nr:hypothetical protein [Candidatus Gastranaerophilales bacterium]